MKHQIMKNNPNKMKKIIVGNEKVSKFYILIEPVRLECKQKDEAAAPPVLAYASKVMKYRSLLISLVLRQQ